MHDMMGMLNAAQANPANGMNMNVGHCFQKAKGSVPPYFKLTRMYSGHFRNEGKVLANSLT